MNTWLMFINIMLFILGIALLYAGGELFIKGATSIGYIFKIKPLIIAITLAAFATSAPEFFVSLTAVLKNSDDLALGNVIGSCTANIALILGICSLIRPIKIQLSLLKKELPILIFASALIFAVCADLYISRIEAAVLLFCFCGFVYYCIKNAKLDIADAEDSVGESGVKSFIFLILATVMLVAGASFLVNSAIVLAKAMGISQLAIGLSVVAVGTSLPEFSVSAVASSKGYHDTSIGNIIGSNIFNLLFIIGVVCIIKPIFVNLETLKIDIPIMIGYSIILLPLLRTGFVLSRQEGVVLILSYFGYIWILFNR